MGLLKFELGSSEPTSQSKDPKFEKLYRYVNGRMTELIAINQEVREENQALKLEIIKMKKEAHQARIEMAAKSQEIFMLERKLKSYQ